MRAITVCVAAVAALSACGGRVEVYEIAAGGTGCSADCEQTAGNAGSSSRAGGAGPISAAGSAGAANDSGGASAGNEAGAGGTMEDNAGSSNQGGSPSASGNGGAGATCSQGMFATEVIDHAFGGGQNVNQTTGFPAVLFGPPVANNPNAVVSLGNGGWVVLGFSGNAIVDGPGADFTVFENPLLAFKELATVAVSEDAEHWGEFPCTAAQDASDYGFCAGVNVVYSSPSNGIDPLDPAVSGGDHYDLADIGVTHARFVRITDRVDLRGSAGVFDLDAVAIIHGECR